MTVARVSQQLVTVARSSNSPTLRVTHEIVTVARSSNAPTLRASHQFVTVARATNTGGRIWPVEQSPFHVFTEGTGNRVLPISLPPASS